MPCKLLLKVKQGEEKSVGFTIKQNGSAMNLSTYTVHVQVKKTPTLNSKPIIDKYITTSTATSPRNIDGVGKIECPSDINVAGQITSPSTGEFQIHLNEKDTSFNTGDYYLIISLEQYTNKVNSDGEYMYDDDNNPIMEVSYCDIISSECCNSAIYKVCEQ